jgi:hypothetical protein
MAVAEPTGQILSVHKQIPLSSNVERGDSILTWRLPAATKEIAP